MESIKITKATTALFMTGVILLTIFMQSSGPRKRMVLLSSYNQYWASNTTQNQTSSETKKQLPISTNIIEEEDKIVESFECISTAHHAILISKSFSFLYQFFDEPLLTVAGLPPWA